MKEYDRRQERTGVQESADYGTSWDVQSDFVMVYGFHNLKALQQIHIHAAGIANQTQNGDFLTFGNMHIQIHALQPIQKGLLLDYL